MRIDIFPILEPRLVRDTKDPCPVFDGKRWHIFGSAGSVMTESWLIFHATGTTLYGPWEEQEPIVLPLQGSGIAAPGVVYEDACFYMFVQTEFLREGGTVEFLTSPDGFTWTHINTALQSLPGTSEQGIYDPHPALIAGERYLVYSGMSGGFPPQPDVYLAKCMTNSWHGPWLRLGKILDHSEIEYHHNRRDHHDYEWGIEGAQLVELPDSRILLNATCFLPVGARGERQRVFFATADDVRGPYRSLGPILEPVGLGENGHSTVVLAGPDLILFYQSRLASTGHLWRYGIVHKPLAAFVASPTAKGAGQFVSS